MKNKLILHIGIPKTGTTAIQRFLYDNQTLLNEKGFSYPSQIQDSKFILTNGSPLMNYVNDKGIPNTEQAGWKEFWDIVRQHLQKNHVIISWEEMYLYNEKFFLAIQKEYENIQIIIYLRRQDRYLESLWNQGIKGEWFNTLDFEQFQNKHMWRLEYLSKLDAISRIVGKNNVIVRVYEKEQFQGCHNVVSDFIYSLGIDLDWDRCILFNKPSNTALFGNYIEIKRRINYNLCKNDFVSSSMNSVFFKYIRSLFRSSKIKHAEGLFAEDERKKFMEQYAEQNAKIAKEYLGRNDGILFYESKSIPMLTIDPSTLCSDIKNVFMFFFKDIERKILVDGDLQCIKNQMLEELEEIQNKELDQSEFEAACFQLVQDDIPKIIEIYHQKIQKIYSNIKEACCRKKDERTFYFFGTGGFCNHIMRVLPEMEMEPDAFLDNDWQKAGSYIHQKPIYHPSQIQDWKNCFVLIAVEKPDMILSIEQQLQQYGLKKNQDYLVTTELL